MCNRARFDYGPQLLFDSTGKLFGERPRDNRFHPQELRPGSHNYTEVVTRLVARVYDKQVYDKQVFASPERACRRLAYIWVRSMYRPRTVA